MPGIDVDPMCSTRSAASPSTSRSAPASSATTRGQSPESGVGNNERAHVGSCGRRDEAAHGRSYPLGAPPVPCSGCLPGPRAVTVLAPFGPAAKRNLHTGTVDRVQHRQVKGVVIRRLTEELPGDGAVGITDDQLARPLVRFRAAGARIGRLHRPSQLPQPRRCQRYRGSRGPPAIPTGASWLYDQKTEFASY
jgi:hypothetical protein